MRLLVKRILQIVGIGSFSLIACIRCKYGIPFDVDPYKAVKTVTGTNQPIQGLSVTLLENSDSIRTILTDENGVAAFEYDFFPDTEHSVKISDIDGAQNLGLFQTNVIILSEPDTTIAEMNVQSK
jgi:hypothetical protein